MDCFRLASSPFIWGGAPKGRRGHRAVASFEASIDFRMVERRMYCFDHVVGVRKHVVVPESQHAESGRSQEMIATRVVCQLRGMVAAIQFHDAFPVERSEVADIESDLVLPSKLEPCHLTPAQVDPKQTLGIGQTLTKLAGVPTHSNRTTSRQGVNVALLLLLRAFA